MQLEDHGLELPPHPQKVETRSLLLSRKSKKRNQRRKLNLLMTIWISLETMMMK
jgi:hypothetical protein